MKLATDIGPAIVLDVLYQHIAPVLHCDDVLEQDALEVELVYQTLRSDILVPVEDLRRFLTAGRPSSLDYFNRLLTVTSACRLSGRYLEGLRFVEETLAYGTSHGLTNRLHQALTAAVQLHLVAEEYDKANATLHEIRRYPTSPENPRMYAEPSYLEGRIALEQQDLRRCSAALNQIVMLPSGYSSSRRAYFFALHVGLKVAEGANAEVLTPYVLELQDAHSRIQSVGIKDFETNSLFLGLSAIGKRDEAVTMLKSYVRSQRRSRWPLSKRLKQALSAAENPMLSGERMSESPTLQDTAVLSTDPLSGVL